MEEIPLIPSNLLDALDKLYPHRCPELTLDEKEVWFKAGQRSVIDFLVAVKAEQEDTVFPPDEFK
jgi:hypothetical protein